jgi:hypothetical protein
VNTATSITPSVIQPPIQQMPAVATTEIPQPSNSNINVVADQQIKRENLVLDISNLDQYAQHFWNQNEIWIESDLS